MRFVGLLEIKPVTPVADEFLRHNKIPLSIGNGDVLEVGKGKVITKVIYLAEPKAGKDTRAVESLVSWFIDPETDPIWEANRRGEILAVLRLAANDELLGLPASKASEAVSDATTPKPDQIVIDLYGGSQVLPGLGKNPGYSKLVQNLNALKGVTVNFREAGKGDAIVMAIVRDPSQRCQREARQTQRESELRIAINSALKAAGIEAVQWEENLDAEVKKTDEVEIPKSGDDAMPRR